MKKNFLPSFQPARLVRGHRWYLVWYCVNDLTGEPERFRQTFKLNRIKDVKMRERRAADLLAKLNLWLESSRPISRFSEQEAEILQRAPAGVELGHTNIVEAIELARDVLMGQTDRADSWKTYRSMCNILCDFLRRRKWQTLTIQEFGKVQAVAFLDEATLRRKVSASTYNNYLTFYRSFWKELSDRGYTHRRPWKEIKPKAKRKIVKQRRNFTDEEARVVIHRIRQESELLFYGLLLEYCCFVRPKELRLLRFQDVNIEEGLVRVTGRVAKNWKERVVTIPDEFRGYFRRAFFEGYPGRYYIFGKGFQPAAEGPCGAGTMYRRHRRVLEDLQASGALEDISGLTWYSWKDTGITDALDYLPIPAVQDQAGHHSPEMTMRYRHTRKVNAQMKKMKNRLL